MSTRALTVTIWLLLGLYFVVASVGGFKLGALMVLLCGYMAGKEANRVPPV